MTLTLETLDAIRRQYPGYLIVIHAPIGRIVFAPGSTECVVMSVDEADAEMLRAAAFGVYPVVTIKPEPDAGGERAVRR